MSLVIRLASFRVRPGDYYRGRAHHVRCQSRRRKRPDEVARGNQHLPSHVPALLVGGELVFEVSTRRARLNQALRQLEDVQGPPEPGLAVSDDWAEPVGRRVSPHVLYLVSPEEGLIEAPHEGRSAVRGIEAHVGIGLARKVRVGRYLPAAQVDGLQPRLHQLDGLVPRKGSEGLDVRIGVEDPPQLLGGGFRYRVLYPDRAPQSEDVLGRVRPLYPGPPFRLP